MVPDEPYIPDNLRLGWTFEDEVGPISFSYMDNYPLSFRTIKENKYPEVGTDYRFEELTYPAVHSIAVGIVRSGE